MKKIAMFTMGTRGDVQPYIYLSKGLMKAGYDVTLGTHPCWRELVESFGVKFAPVGPDIDIEKETGIIRGKSKNAVMSLFKTMNFITKIIEGATDEVYEVCKGKDLIIVTHSQIGAVEAGVLGIPKVNVTLQTEMIGEKLRKQKFFEKMIGKFISKKVSKPTNIIRKKYGLKPLVTGEEEQSDKLNLIPISKYVLERNPYWEEKNILTGYWYDENEEYTPDEKLKAFVEAGEKPIVLALGAMSFETSSDRAKLDMFVNAFKKTGQRAVIQGFKKTLEDYELPDTMIAIGSVPHSWLFRNAKCVIHHCGFGTTAAAMIYGVPSIPVPHILDQVGLAVRLEKTGTATKMIKAKDLNEETLTAAIEELNSTYAVKKRNAEVLSEKISTEHGVETAVRLIEEKMEWN